MANWELKKCCNHEQIVFLSTTAVCTVVILALWRTVLLLPFKLVTVFLHEASHAIACKLTCGHVEEIQVHADEGGMTTTRGGVYWFILPAGCNCTIFRIIILGYGFNTCIDQSSDCKNRMFGPCTANCPFYRKKLDTSRIVHWIHCTSCCSVGLAGDNKSAHPPLYYHVHWYNEQLVLSLRYLW